MNYILKILIAAIFASSSIALAQVTDAQLSTAQQQAMSMTASQVPPPAPPNYSQCTGRTDEANCRQQLDNQYQQNLAIYNKAKLDEAAFNQQQAAQQAQYNSAKQAALDAQKQNQTAQKKYDISQILTMAASVAAAAKFAATCATTPPACQYPYLALSMVMAMFSNQAGQQSNSHANAQYSSCTLANQISTSQANCGSPPGQFNFAGYPNNSPVDPATIVDTSGKCIASADICSQIESGLPPGTSLKDYQKGLSAFAGPNAPFKVNADGSITDKNGKKFTADNFKDAASMAASGMSPADINMATNMMKNMGAGSIDTKKDLTAFAGNGSLGGFGDDAAGKGGVAGANANGNGTLDKDAADAAAKKRSLASTEGLSKDFNGELIGISGDDIFKMMNRRYRLKDSQDSFLGIRP